MVYPVVAPESLETRYTPEPNSGCWLWDGPIRGQGYGGYYVKAEGQTRGYYAHRVAYIAHRGAVPDGLQLDHLCRVRLCVNPAHLEPVTARENLMRGSKVGPQVARTHCPRGHPYDERNTYRHRGHRYCRRCHYDGATRRRKGLSWPA